jgi:hypothetical protein
MLRTAILLVVLVLFAAPSASAQDTPAVDLSAGYALLRDKDLDENFHGFVAAAGFNVNR